MRIEVGYWGLVGSGTRLQYPAPSFHVYFLDTTRHFKHTYNHLNHFDV